MKRAITALAVIAALAGSGAAAGCGSSATVAAASVTATAVQTVQTADGTVGYRSVGHGSPLVMIMGFSGSMDDWQPSFVDALATHYRVVLFDNAGIGRTSALPAPLTISAMAGQTSALISSLHLGAPDVLGWSMGGMIAQALAVEHPSQVHRMVLSATLPGDGQATLPSAAAISQLDDTTDPAAVLSLLFPAGDTTAVTAYVIGIRQYPGFYAAGPSAIKAQEATLSEWTSGKDPAGPGLPHITAPTLVADGTADPLVPLADDRHLAATIPGAQLVTYPGAAHAFLFQDQGAFVARVVQFLGGD